MTSIWLLYVVVVYYPKHCKQLVYRWKIDRGGNLELILPTTLIMVSQKVCLPLFPSYFLFICLLFLFCCLLHCCLHSDSWNSYCERQKKLRVEFTSQAAVNKAIFSNIHLSNPLAMPSSTFYYLLITYTQHTTTSR